jgi:tetratricopeptide (TPR) repeat protein
LTALIAAVTLVTYAPALGCDFVNFDDEHYVTQNSQVQAGLTVRGMTWSFTTTQASNWHPLTWLSLMLDAQLYGQHAWGYHLTNLLLHLANSLLLFALLRCWTGACWRSLLVALLFAVHPLHVESVAWVSERKDVLSTLFGLLSLAAYTWYVGRPSLVRYLPILVCFALSLLAKPMLVTLPALLLLLDFWPLQRWQPTTASWLPGRLLLEKLPLLTLSVASSIATVWAQQAGRAVASLEVVSVGERLSNALLSYGQYLRQMVLPTDLACFYPYPRPGLSLAVVASAVLVLGVTVLVLRLGRRWPYLPVGWLWYLGTLVPVIGLVQVGFQARADRYTYFPLIGIFVLVVWGLADLAVRRHWQRLASLLAGGLIASLGIVSWSQVHVWQNTAALWEHALKVNPDNHLAHDNMGIVCWRRGDLEGSLRHFQQALRIKPNFAHALNDMGVVLRESRRYPESIQCFTEALRLDPGLILARVNLGAALLSLGQNKEAIAQFEEVVRVDPQSIDAHRLLGESLLREGRAEEAIAPLAEAVRLQPGDAEALANLAAAQVKAGHFAEAIATCREARDRAAFSGQASLARALEERLRLYEQKQTLHVTTP